MWAQQFSSMAWLKEWQTKRFSNGSRAHAVHEPVIEFWQGWKESNLRMPESKSGALTNLATPLHRTVARCLTFKQPTY